MRPRGHFIIILSKNCNLRGHYATYSWPEGHTRGYSLHIGKPIGHFAIHSPFEGTLEGTLSHFLTCREAYRALHLIFSAEWVTLKVTPSCFFAHILTLEGTASCIFHWKGTLLPFIRFLCLYGNPIVHYISFSPL